MPGERHPPPRRRGDHPLRRAAKGQSQDLNDVPGLTLGTGHAILGVESPDSAAPILRITKTGTKAVIEVRSGQARFGTWAVSTIEWQDLSCGWVRRKLKEFERLVTEDVNIQKF